MQLRLLCWPLGQTRESGNASCKSNSRQMSRSTKSLRESRRVVRLLSQTLIPCVRSLEELEQELSKKYAMNENAAGLAFTCGHSPGDKVAICLNDLVAPPTVEIDWDSFCFGVEDCIVSPCPRRRSPSITLQADILPDIPTPVVSTVAVLEDFDHQDLLGSWRNSTMALFLLATKNTPL